MVQVFPVSARWSSEENYSQMSNGEYKAARTFLILVILEYTALLVLTCVNVWCILLKQQKWRNLPLTLFYSFTFIAVVTRLFLSIGNTAWFDEDFYKVIVVAQPLAKLMVGLIQSYIIFELGIRIRSSRDRESLQDY